MEDGEGGLVGLGEGCMLGLGVEVEIWLVLGWRFRWCWDGYLVSAGMPIYSVLGCRFRWC